MKKDFLIFLKHILESIALIEEYEKDTTEDEFLSNPQQQDAVIRRIEIIWEAIKNIPAEFKQRHPDILIHEYFGIDLKLTWRVVRFKIPELKEKILEIKEDLERG